MADVSRFVRRISSRVYQDLFMPSRLPDYSAMLKQLRSAGYTFATLEHYAARVLNNEDLGPKTAIIRHDVDTDVRTAAQMFEIEKALGICSSYYFRLTTLDYSLMRKIAASGGEASYHFEEIAHLAKKHGLRSREQVLRHMPEVRDLFRNNLQRIRAESGLPMTVVASHGDFVNRALQMYNHELLDEALRDELDILAEVYDPILEDRLSARVTDRPHPTYWDPVSPLAAVAAGGVEVVYILVHPKQWFANVSSNLRELVTRSREGAAYAVARRSSA